MAAEGEFKLCTFAADGGGRAGIVVGDQVLEAQKAYDAYRGAKGGPALNLGAVVAILDAWEQAFPALKNAAAHFAGRKPDFARPLAGARLQAPIQYPRKIFCAAANYLDHMKEMGSSPPDKAKTEPYFFLKIPTTCVIGPGEAIRIPQGVKNLDWEAEMAVVIGRRAKDVPRERAFDYVAGYTIMNDVSARDKNVRGDWVFKYDWLYGKCHDTFAPMGPYLVPHAFVSNCDKLDIKLTLNGQVMQDSSTDQLIFKTDEMIAWLSALCTLEPGDVISTGTPAGVGRPRGIFLKPGDRIVIELSEVGTLENPVA
ncbi:MAG: fumarylacetoacetate hydrolase family protein [Deltaproteobacteria bacterium]|nr:fumarylacetoacetate hydrolase family protein [Deltaproteobacteria bacterium]